MFGAAHWPYIIILLVVVLIIFGPGRLPELGSGLGKAINEFRKTSTEVKDGILNSHQTTEQAAAASTSPTAPAPPAAAAPAEEKKEEQKTSA